MPPGRVPGPPECGVTSPARGRRTADAGLARYRPIKSLRLQAVPRRRPQPSQATLNIVLIGIKSRAARQFSQPHARLVAVREDDAGPFERTADGFDCARLQRFPGFKPGNRTRSGTCEHCQLSDTEMKGGSRHSALGRSHNTAPN